MTAMLELTDVGKDLHHASAGRRAPAGGARRHVSGRSRRMRGAVRPVRRRQIVDPEDDLRQLPLRRAAASASAMTARDDRYRHAPSRGKSCRVRQRAHRLCQPVPARGAAGCRRSTSSPSRWSAKRSRRDEARAQAGEMLRRFNMPERLWSLPPATFSGGEQQRINIARGLSAGRSRSCCSTSRPPRSMPTIAAPWSTDRARRSGRARPSSPSCTTTRCARRSPTASSMSPISPRRREHHVRT